MSALVSPPSLTDTLGIALIGVLVAWSLYGISCLQMFRYYTTYPGDHSGLKSTVAILWVLDTCHSAFIAHAIYFYLVSHFGDYFALTDAVWSIIIPVGLNCISAFIVQMFLARRVYILSEQNKILVFLIFALSLAQLAVGLAVMSIGFKLRVFSELIRFKSLVTTSLLSAALADVTIAASLCYYLANKKSCFSKTNTMINTLIIYAVNSGLFTSLLAIAGFITFLTMPNNLVNYAINFVIGKVYSNCLLSILNARENLRRENQITPLQVLNRSDSASQAEESQTYYARSKLNSNMAIKTETSTHVTVDYA